MQLAPLIAANDPLPVELQAEADGATHRAGDMMFRASSLAFALRVRPATSERTIDGLAVQFEALAAEGRAFAAASHIIAQRLKALEAKASS